MYNILEEDEQFYNWWQKKKNLNENIGRVCSRYGNSLKQISWEHERLIHNSEHNLLLCLNNKACRFKLIL